MKSNTKESQIKGGEACTACVACLKPEQEANSYKEKIVMPQLPQA